MAKITLKLDKPVEGVLNYATGKHYPSKFENREGSFMYGLASGDAIFIEEQFCQKPDMMFRERRIGVGIPFSICLRKSPSGEKYYEVLNLQGVQSISQGTAAAPASDLEQKLQASIDQQQQTKAQRENPSKSTPATQSNNTAEPSTVATSVQQQSHLSALDTIRHSTLSQLLSGCMIAVIDSIKTGKAYAESQGMTLNLTESSTQDLVTSALIHVQRMAELECRYGISTQTPAVNRVAAAAGGSSR